MENAKLITPNTILIGAQKAATTSLYNWIAQHPDVCGPATLKDYAFFAYDEFFNQGLESLSHIYKKEYNQEKIVIHGFVNYMFFEKSIKRIYNFNKDIKLIMSLRNPTDRAISAYEYQVKSQKEPIKTFLDALKAEESRMEENDYSTVADLTYFNHGLYYKQLQIILKYFPLEQIKVVFYEDINTNPKQLILDVYSFLEVDNSFTPKFKTMNKTGEIKNKTIHKLFYSRSPIKQKIVKYLIDPIFPLEKRLKVKIFINEYNTKDKARVENTYPIERAYLQDKFKEDIEQLEKLLHVDLTQWKK
ncbi:Sulfotransferase domain-containing protein [Bizionia echini]|uniref:Sulfotransferase domain-containing protein n=1 Tax=Bizionia echini TaxID=649333 RepID=A0A1I4Z8N0_9FLAO|nr:sulfotransferase domain-containing protein [Bizionia echini]SFN46635.1 Sulfotransferase domain-containing protein [Bizionia echini]